MKIPSLPLARVRYWHSPEVPPILVGSASTLVVVPTDDEIQFAIEGPDPTIDGAFNQRFLTREQAFKASSFLRPFAENTEIDLDALVSESEHFRFVWTVARYEAWEGSIGLTHHARYASACRRAEQIEASIAEERRRSRNRRPFYADVYVSVHRLED
jgi:hypothetical protein